MQNTDRAGESKKKKRKRTIDKAKVAENKKKAKAKKARIKAQSREEKEREKGEKSAKLKGSKVTRAEITIIELGEDQDEDLLAAAFEEVEALRMPEDMEAEELEDVEEADDMEEAEDAEAGTEADAEDVEAGIEAADESEDAEAGTEADAEDVEAGIEAADESEDAESETEAAAEPQNADVKTEAEKGKNKRAGKSPDGNRKEEVKPTGRKSQKSGTSPAGKNKKTEKSGKRKDAQKLKKKAGILAACILVLALAGAGINFGMQRHLKKLEAESAVVEAMVHTEAVELARHSKIAHQKEHLQRNAGKGTSKALVDAARFMLDGVKRRPKPVEITEENALDFATIESCLINTDTGKVDVTMSAEGLAISDDGYYYLFEEKTYDTELTGEEYIIEEPKDVDLTFSVNLNYNSASSRLFSKFVVAIKKDGQFMAVSRPRYITNPEAIAKYRPSFGNTKSKKGLLVDPNKLRGTELDDLGVKHAAYNIPMSKILGETTMAVYPTIYYNYNGRTYAFNGQAISEYDFVFTTLSNKGITTTAIILNDMAPGHTQLIHPKARSGNKRSLYYAFNGTDDSGTEYMAAIGSFLASRYSGTGHGTVMNWVISNEINARSEWNYIEYMDTESYVEEFAKPFRIFYNAIVSVNGNARVYISLDQQWGKSLYSNNGYGSKEILDEFNRNIKNGGNIDWGLAQHPYNYPLTSAKAWSLSSKAASYVTESENTPVLTIKNIHVLTNYLQKPEMLTDDGKVRHLILSEMGYTSTAGQDLQAASFAYAYKIIEANQYIDSVLLSRQTDASVEVQQGLALGINDPGGAPKSLYTVYKYIDTPECAQYTDYLLPVIGISSWSEVIR